MRTLLLGTAGQVGAELLPRLSALGQVSAPPRAELDVGDLTALTAAYEAVRPTLVVNTTAWNDVDGAERDREGAFRLNRDVPARLGELCARDGAVLVHFSTDFVFDGALEGRAYREEDPPNPLSAYGASKLAGEVALEGKPALVFRTAWVWSLRRKSFVSTMLALAHQRPTLSVVDDQIGCPTYAADLAEAVAKVAVLPGLADRAGLYHLAGTGEVSRFDFAKAIFELDPRRAEQVVKDVLAVKSDAFPTPAVRPKRAPLDCAKAEKLLGVRLRPWREALAAALT